MNIWRKSTVASLFLAHSVAVSLSAQCVATSASNVLTGQYDPYRSGENLNETILTPANVTSSKFGYLYSLSVDPSPVFAQPLVVHNLTINGTSYCTVVFVATMDNYVYAFNGDEATDSGSPYIWKSAQFGTPVPYGPYIGFTNMGIIDTPVIDINNQVLYFVSLAEEGTGTAGWTYRLHAISLTTGTEFFAGNQTAPGGIVISGSVPGTGAGSVKGMVPFVPPNEKPRAALLDVDGTIYVTFGFGAPTNGVEDNTPYHGWVFSYKSCLSGSMTCATDPPCFTGAACGLQQISMLNTTPDGRSGGIWMTGRGPAFDGGSGVYLSVGNGCYIGGNPANCPFDGYSESVINYTTLDFYLPASQSVVAYDYNDLDFDAGGVLMIPPVMPASVSSLLVAGGKTGTVALLQTTGLSQQTGNPYQQFQASGTTAECPSNLPVYEQAPLGTKQNPGGCDEYHLPAYWSRGSTGYLYSWASSDSLRAFAFNTTGNEQFNPTPVVTFAAHVEPGNAAALAISANQNADGILWAITGNANYSYGELSAFRLWNPLTATPVLTQIWTSAGHSSTFFDVQRFTVPVVSNGKVYVTTPSTDSNGNTQVLVYGLCSDAAGGCQTLVTGEYLRSPL